MIVVPMLPDPLRRITDQLLDWMAKDRAARAEEAYRQATTDQYAPGCTDLYEVFFRPLTGDEWQSLGYAPGPIVSMDFDAPDPADTAVVAWPHQYGKTVTLTASFEASLTGDTCALFDAVLAGHRAQLDRRLHRLAKDLGQWEPHVRHDFHRVQQVLEETGIGDGYGQLTIPQPVRPPIEPPSRRH